jgi:hypothetical protein
VLAWIHTDQTIGIRIRLLKQTPAKTGPRNEHENAKEFVNRIRRGYKAFLKPMPKTTQPPGPIRISTNTILNGRFYNRGEPLPVASAADLPDNLKPLVVTEPEAEEEPNEPRGSFETGVVYEMTSDGRLGRAVRRQAAVMEAAAQEDEWIEEQMDAPLPPQIAESLQEAHESSVARQAAQAAADTARADQASDAAAAASEPPRLYVKRGSRHYAPADKARLKPGEPVYVRQPEGGLECIGTTDSKAELPDLPITL